LGAILFVGASVLIKPRIIEIAPEPIQVLEPEVIEKKESQYHFSWRYYA